MKIRRTGISLDQRSRSIPEAELSFKDFFEILVVFYTCDASSYRHLEGLFKMDPRTKRIEYRDNVKIGMEACREVLGEVLEDALELS